MNNNILRCEYCLTLTKEKVCEDCTDFQNEISSFTNEGVLITALCGKFATNYKEEVRSAIALNEIQVRGFNNIEDFRENTEAHKYGIYDSLDELISNTKPL